MEKSRHKTSSFWSENDRSSTDKNFYAFPALRSRLCRLVFNEDDCGRGDWCQYWTVEKYLKESLPFSNALSLCCGFGGLERALVNMGVVEKILGVDIAPGAIERARHSAAEEGLTGIEYAVRDLTGARFPANSFDLIWGNGALHHIENLGIFIPMLYEALRPGGYLIATEYVGPRYQQLGLRQQELVNAVKHLLPENLRETNATDPSHFLLKLAKRVKRAVVSGPFSSPHFSQVWWPVPERWFVRYDPSECVNSHRIIPQLQDTFDEVNVRYFGGSILYYALDHVFYDTFDPADATHAKILDMLCSVEDSLIATGEIGNDNAHIVCRKRLPDAAGV